MNTELKLYVTPEYITAYETSWKKVPGYINTYASLTGEIRLLNSKGELVKAIVVRRKTTKGSYIYAKLVNDSFSIVRKAVHQIICVTYHGDAPNDGRIYEPNHKNGDKHDNSPSNLEWTTRKENVQHAFDSGLCSAGIRIEALNVLTGQSLKYNSLSRMSREWDISRNVLRNLLAQYRDTPYQGEWVFIVDDNSDKKLSRHQRSKVIFKDYVTGNTVITNDVTEAGTLTKINFSTINYRVNLSTSSNKYNSLLSKYIFRKFSNDVIWPVFTVEAAKESEKMYNLKGKNM